MYNVDVLLSDDKKKNVRKFTWLLTEHVYENDIYCE